jgi:hypothetical protein
VCSVSQKGQGGEYHCNTKDCPVPHFSVRGSPEEQQKARRDGPDKAHGLCTLLATPFPPVTS